MEDKFWKTKIIIRAISFLEGDNYLKFIEMMKQKEEKKWLSGNNLRTALDSIFTLLAKLDKKMLSSY